MTVAMAAVVATRIPAQVELPVAIGYVLTKFFFNESDGLEFANVAFAELDVEERFVISQDVEATGSP